MTDRINILHLSDLHFGIEPSPEIAPTAIAQRKNVLDGLLSALSLLELEWKPNIAIISGDIGWKGKKEDYGQAKLWLINLLKSINLPQDNLILCPGNHDIDRDETTGLNPPSSPQEADDWLKVEKLKNFIRPFTAFGSFCDDMNVPSLAIANRHYPLIGQRNVLGLNIIVLNSAWFSRKKDDKGNLWIGRPQLELMKASSQLIDPRKYDEAMITVTVLHHPPADLNSTEYTSYDTRKAPFSTVSEHSHIILCGHSHGTIERPNREFNYAWLFKGGATYAGDDYRNNFSLFQINTQNRTVIRRSFKFKPGDGKWDSIIDPDPYDLRLKPVSLGGQSGDAKLTYDYKALSKKAKDAASRYIEQKSSVLSRTDNLPAFIQRKVAVHNREIRIERKKGMNIQLDTKDNVAPLTEMVSVECPTFLFGELGSGKSTLVGQYVVELSEQVDGLIPLLIPAKYFQNKKHETVFELSQLISRYASEHIYPSGESFDLLAALRLKLEITLVIDGFDELDIKTAQNLLTQLENFVYQWSVLRVIATGRPIELQGLNYNRWQCLEMRPLSNEEQFDLLFNEAVASNLTAELAKNDANTRLSFLKQNPELLSIATTPLTVRLLRPYLKNTGQKKSVGDLLYDVIHERLGNWGIKDQKEDNFREFKQLFPDSLSREGLLGDIAWGIHSSANKTISKDALHALISAEINEVSNKNAVVSQGCEFFTTNLLQQEGDTFSFPSLPLFQCALGIYIANNLLRSYTHQFCDDESKLWREYSFAAAVARRKNLIPKLRTKFQAYVDTLLRKKTLPAAAIIVAESGNADLARHYVSSLKDFDFRPLNYFEDFKSMSPAAYAQSFFLAGEDGFKWFFDEYLDPRYPMPWQADYHVQVLQHWLLLSEFKLTSYQKKSLSVIPMPHLSARSWEAHGLLPSISIVLPELFNPIQMVLLWVECFSSPLTREKAMDCLRREYINGNKDAVLNALETACNKDEYGSALTAVKLWLELSPEKPPLSVIRSIILAAIKVEWDQVYKELIERIGRKNLQDTLRWYVLQNDRLATAAALLLHKAGEKNLYLIGKGLLAGLHDGGKFAGAEEALSELVRNEGEKGLLWLVNQFPLAGGISDGAHSAYWRILLKELNRYEQNYLHWLRFAVRYLGEFILPRYPDIRREFWDLLSNKPVYRETLHDTLRSFDAHTRYNAACILFSCFPETESYAAEIVISATTKAFERHEWNRFCLRLSLGKAVIEHIASKLDSSLPVPKTFALALLYHNRYSISKDQYRSLITGLLKEGSFDYGHLSGDDNLKQILAEDKAYEILIDILDNSTSVAEAADNLFQYHRTKLDTDHYAKCLSYVIKDTDTWNLMKLDNEAERLTKDAEFLNKVVRRVHEIQQQKSEEPIIGIYLRAISDDLSAWKDILWAAIFRGFHNHTRVGHSFLWIFNRGKKNPTIGQAIGKAALELLDDHRIFSDQMYNDAIPWLAFIAHEFVGLPDDRLEKFILHYRSITEEIISALIARLGHVPNNFKPGNNRNYLMVFHEYKRIVVDPPSLIQLVEITRDADEIHDEFMRYIEIALLSDALSENEIKELAYKSKLGALFSIMVSFARSNFIDFDLIVRITGICPPESWQQKPTLKQADAVFKGIRRMMFESDNRDDYIICIQDAIKNNKYENIIHLFKDLLENEIQINEELLPTLLAEIATHQYKLDRTLAFFLSNHLASCVVKEKKNIFLVEIKKIIKSFSSEADKYNSQNNALCQLLFALAVFYLQNDIDIESERVFLLGLQSAFIQRYETQHLHNNKPRFFMRDVLYAVYPLLDKTPRWIIRKVIDNGSHSDSPEISSICRILLAIG
jgi:hypothetical protein